MSGGRPPEPPAGRLASPPAGGAPERPAPAPVHDGDRWEAALARASVPAAAVAVAVAEPVALALRGPSGAVGLLLGGLLAGTALAVPLLVARRTRRAHPVSVLLAALGAYALTMSALLVALAVVRRAGAPDPASTGAGVLLVVLVWLPAQLRAFARLRLLHVDPDQAPEARQG